MQDYKGFDRLVQKHQLKWFLTFIILAILIIQEIVLAI
jgi:hypothetical protein